MNVTGELTQSERVTLTKIYARYQTEMSREMLNNEGFDVAVNGIANRIVVAAKFSVYGINHADKTYKYPCNWVEAIKHRWLPEWVKRWWPVQYRIIVITLKELYPNISPALKNERVEWNIQVTNLPFVDHGTQGY